MTIKERFSSWGIVRLVMKTRIKQENATDKMRAAGQLQFWITVVKMLASKDGSGQSELVYHIIGTKMGTFVCTPSM